MERRRYLMFQKDDWEEFKGKVDAKDVKQENAMLKAQAVQKMIDDSNSLKRDWDDTYEKIIAKQEAERERKKAAQNESRMNFYKQYLEQKRIEREKMLAQADDFNFRQRDEPKTLLSSLMCSEALRQVAVQRAFNEKLRAEEREEELQYARDVKAHVKEWEKITADRNRRKREKNVQVAKYIQKQHSDKLKDELDKKNERLEIEREDIIKSNKEMEELRQHDINTRIKYAQFVKSQGEQAVEMVRKRKHENKVLDEMEDKMIEVYLAVTCKISRITKEKLQHAADEKERFNELTRSRFPRKEAILWAKEERSMKKAQEEYERREIEVINFKKAKHDAQMEDKRKCHREWMQKVAEQKENEDAIRRWEIANRLENDELTKEFKERERQLKQRQMKEYTDFLDKQKQDLEEKKKAEKEELYDFYHTKRLKSLKDINDKFIEYSTKLVEECKQTKRPSRPLEKTIADYKEKYMAPPRKYPSRYLPTCPPKPKSKK